MAVASGGGAPCGCKRSHVALMNEAKFLHDSYTLAAESQLMAFVSLEREILDWCTFAVILVPFCFFWALDSPEWWQHTWPMHLLVFPWYGPQAFWRAHWWLKVVVTFLYCMFGAACRRYWFPRNATIRFAASNTARKWTKPDPYFRLWRARHPITAFAPVRCTVCNQTNRWRRAPAVLEFGEWLRTRPNYLEMETLLAGFDSAEPTTNVN